MHSRVARSDSAELAAMTWELEKAIRVTWRSMHAWRRTADLYQGGGSRAWAEAEWTALRRLFEVRRAGRAAAKGAG